MQNPLAVLPHRAVTALACLLSVGCVVGDALPFTEDDPPDPAQELFGVISQPRHGTIVVGSTADAAIPFVGLHSEPGYRIDIQVLTDPTQLDSWVTITSAISSDTASPEAAPDELYPWNGAAIPGGQRWPQGGLVRVRAVGEQGETLARFYHDSEDCIANEAGGSVIDQVEQCGDTVDTGLVLVSPANDLADDPSARPQFLVSRGIGTPTETAEYYAEINAPATVADFSARFGFDPGTDPVATYYNMGDLATGREIRCRPYDIGGTSGVACLTSNYGGFSGDPRQSLELAISGTESQTSVGAFATVAMIYQAPITAPNSVQFMVYGGNGQLVTEAELDTYGDNASIPQNCLNCHGTQATYDAATNSVTNARFLPFDPLAFVFSERVGYQAADQAEAVRRLNQMIYDAGLTLGQREIIDGMYGIGRVATPGVSADVTFAPTSWSDSRQAIKTYQNAVAPFCRTCHASREQAGGRDIFDFSTAQSMKATALLIGNVVCGQAGVPTSHEMPNAQAVVRTFWAGPARAYLADFLELPGSCAP